MNARCDALHAWRRVLERLESGMTVYDGMPALLRAAAEGETHAETARFLCACAERMECDPRTLLWEAAEGSGELSLSCEDRAALSPVWRALGASGAQESRSALNAAIRQIALCCAEAEKTREKNDRLAASLGVIGALAVFLFLI